MPSRNRIIFRAARARTDILLRVVIEAGTNASNIFPRFPLHARNDEPEEPKHFGNEQESVIDLIRSLTWRWNLNNARS